MPRRPRRIALVGNPNVGKSVIFSRLTGTYAMVSNYPGTTVAITRGRTALAGEPCEIIDTPGVNSLVPQSEDERATRDILLRERPDAVVQVADAKNLLRSLLLTSQLADLQVPVVLDLNMIDESRRRGLELDRTGLQHALGIPVVETVAIEGRGLSELIDALGRAKVPKAGFTTMASAALGEVRETMSDGAGLPIALVAEWLTNAGDPARDTAVKAVADGRSGRLIDALAAYEQRHHEPLGALVARERTRWLQEVADRFRARRAGPAARLAERIGRATREPLTGLPVLAGVLYLLYLFVGVFGAQTLVRLIEDTIFGRYINPAAAAAIDRFLPLPFVHALLVGEYGLITMGLTYSIAIVLPVVTTFFLAFGLLEDSGYLPRLAILSDRMFRAMGLNGKAVLPMVLGLGCDTMATLTTRILGSPKERLIAILLLALGVPCSAQLGAIMGILGGVSFAALLTLFGVVLAQMLAVGFLAARILPGDRSDFILELPPIRLPQPRNLFIKTRLRIRWYLREAVPLFLFGTLVLFALDRFHLLGLLTRAAEPVVSGLLGLPKQAAQVFIMGFLRRDYGAAGLFAMAKNGQLSGVQAVVGLTVMTLFIPCVANFLMIVREKGVKIGLGIVLFITPVAILTGAAMHFVFRAFHVTF